MELDACDLGMIYSFLFQGLSSGEFCPKRGSKRMHKFGNVGIQILGTISFQLNRIEGKSFTKTYKTENDKKSENEQDKKS